MVEYPGKMYPDILYTRIFRQLIALLSLRIENTILGSIILYLSYYVYYHVELSYYIIYFYLFMEYYNKIGLLNKKNYTIILVSYSIIRFLDHIDIDFLIVTEKSFLWK